MKTDLKYTIFKTECGFFGLLVDKRGVLRTVLPLKNSKKVKKYLLVGISNAMKEDKKLFPALQNAVRNYYKGNYINFEKVRFTISITNCSLFVHKVVKACKSIQFGQTTTYTQLAKKAGFPNSARAAGNVLAKNPLPLIIPCHRVIRADGKIGNFSTPGKSKTKKKMLDLEKSICSKGWF